MYHIDEAGPATAAAAPTTTPTDQEILTNSIVHSDLRIQLPAEHGGKIDRR
jgi:hypothetical protein